MAASFSIKSTTSGNNTTTVSQLNSGSSSTSILIEQGTTGYTGITGPFTGLIGTFQFTGSAQGIWGDGVSRLVNIKMTVVEEMVYATFYPTMTGTVPDPSPAGLSIEDITSIPDSLLPDEGWVSPVPVIRDDLVDVGYIKFESILPKLFIINCTYPYGFDQGNSGTPTFTVSWKRRTV